MRWELICMLKVELNKIGFYVGFMGVLFKKKTARLEQDQTEL
jgi:hypothetical protein